MRLSARQATSDWWAETLVGLMDTEAVEAEEEAEEVEVVLEARVVASPVGEEEAEEEEFLVEIMVVVLVVE